ncbi:hypothetical protein, partial [Staphylococcus aureus]
YAEVTTEEKAAYTNSPEEMLSPATDGISRHPTNSGTAQVRHSARVQVYAQRFFPLAKEKAIVAIREAVK